MELKISTRYWNDENAEAVKTKLLQMHFWMAVVYGSTTAFNIYNILNKPTKWGIITAILYAIPLIVSIIAIKSNTKYEEERKAKWKRTSQE